MKKEFYIVCTVLFILIFGTYISGTLLVPYAKTLGGTGMSIGVIYSCMYVVRLLLGTPIGRISKNKGTKTILTYSLILYPFIAVAYLISWNIPSLLAARLLHGVASAMMLPMAMAYIGETSPTGQEGRYMGIYNTILFIASALGPFAGGLIYDTYGIRYAFLSLLILALLSLIIILFFTRKIFKTTSAKAPEPKLSADRKDAGYQFLRNKKLFALSSISIASAILMALLGASFTQLALSYHISMGTIGLLIALLNAVIGITQVPIGHFTDKHNKLTLLLLSGIVTALLVFVIPFIGNTIGIAILIMIVGLFTSLNLAASTALSAVLGKEIGMNETMGFLGSVNSAGTIIGYLLLGWLADLYDIRFPFYLTGLLYLIGTGLFCMFWLKHKKL